MIIAKTNGDLIEIRFVALKPDAFQVVVSKIKTIPGRKFHAPEGKSEAYWTVPSSELETLQKMFPRELQVEEQVEIIAPKNLSMDLAFFNESKLELRPFQILGANFLCFTGSCILADAPGLGKSPEAISAAYKMARMGYAKRCLVVTPASLKYQWRLEVEKFFDLDAHGYQYCVVDGTLKQRQTIYDMIREDDSCLFTIINYELMRNDIDILKTMAFDIIIADEAHRVANWKTATNEAIRQLNGRLRWALTGTPIQNKPDEIHTLFEWVKPGFLGNLWMFRNRYMIIGDKYGQSNMVLGFKNLRELHQKISPYMLRRLKKDVAPELPPLLINTYWIQLTPHQRRIHDTIASDLLDLMKELSKTTVRDDSGEIIEEDERGAQVMGMFMLLQETCDSLELLVMSGSAMAKKYLPPNPEKIPGFFACPKLQELETVLKEYFVNWESDVPPKAVVFSQFERMQQIMLREIPKMKLGISTPHVYKLNGKMNAKDKEASRIQFKQDSSPAIFLATDSGNYGINLEEAALLINIDVPWNPAVYDQRNNRIHRLVSKHEALNVADILAQEALDERIMNTIYAKSEVAKTIVESGETERQYLGHLTRSLIRKLAMNTKPKDR